MHLPNPKNKPSYTSQNNDMCQPSSLDKQADAVIATTPSAASTMYRNKSLWTDFNVSGNSVRVAFRFVFHTSNTGDGDSTNEEIHLCWINSDGTPHHFYPLNPSEYDGEVTTSDHIESTFPGHGFVFCKRLKEDDIPAILESRQCVREKEGMYIVQCGWGTIFLRKREIEDSNSSSESESESEDEKDDDSNDSEGSESDVSEASHYSLISKSDDDEESVENNNENTDEEQSDNESKVESLSALDLEDDWEAYLIVGGFRLGTKSVPAVDVDHDEIANDGKSDDKDDSADSKKEDESNASSNDASITDDDDDEWNMQLVTLVQTKVDGNSKFKSTPSLRGAAENANHNHLPYQDIFQHNQFHLSAKLTALDPTPVNTVHKYYKSKTVGGWPCKVEPGSLSQRKLRKRITSDLQAACKHLPPHACKKLHKSTPIWINKTLAYGPKVAPIQEANMCFHPGRGWLKRNGMNPAKKGGVEMYRSDSYLDDCFLWGQGGLMLHELSHAWHCLHCDDGYDNKLIQETYDKAMEEKLYDCVEFHCDRGKKDRMKAYACENAMEYFAELSAAFLGGLDDKEYNKWYPFNRKQIKEHDPRAFEMLCRMWGVSEDEYGKV
jgi:hypothetical protein